ncbi:hypothetical protein [Parasulfitobacter algicola]|uniref:Uncharacterized protein n=1 Tax=Parasulfitobacter algicola TaxID=2614809 RepID=A0ABX2IX43_9RHOB|nr:hypothetical protein [Sulfitobacter algicola]NSX55582.1 hypothetical protein [Sulfitobacter algicola]
MKKTAYSLETALIDFSGYFELPLTNRALGHKSSLFGLMTADDIHRRYAAEPLSNLGEGCVIININKNYKRAQSSEDIYYVTKASCVISENRTKSLKYVLAEFRGFIVEVFEVDHWYRAEGSKNRWCFEGTEAPHNIRNKYINRSIVKKQGAANPITYTL